MHWNGLGSTRSGGSSWFKDVEGLYRVRRGIAFVCHGGRSQFGFGAPFCLILHIGLRRRGVGQSAPGDCCGSFIDNLSRVVLLPAVAVRMWQWDLCDGRSARLYRLIFAILAEIFRKTAERANGGLESVPDPAGRSCCPRWGGGGWGARDPRACVSIGTPQRKHRSPKSPSDGPFPPSNLALQGRGMDLVQFPLVKRFAQKAHARAVREFSRTLQALTPNSMHARSI